MCGISGVYGPGAPAVDPERIRRMLAQIQYRGPDESGIYLGEGVGLGSVRLSIIDLAQGQQPMSTGDGKLWIVYNGEIFNYIELRDELSALGYRLRTSSDTEVLLYLFRHYRERCLEKLNGQFAFAIWDTERLELFLARDRMGIRPLFYTRQKEEFLFGSEIKCLFEAGGVVPELDPRTLNQAFTFWSIPSPGTLFKGIYEVPPASYMVVNGEKVTTGTYWELGFGDPGSIPSPGSVDSFRSPGSTEEYMEEFESILSDAVRLRLRADVQVAAYLSGGIDSSATTHYIKAIEPGVLNTFSIGFEEDEFDETRFQEMVARRLDTQHSAVTCRNSDVADRFAEVLWHTETPLLRTGAVPMFLLSGHVHESRIKVVITGEGADEFLGGYNIFKEALVREFWARQPGSAFRPLLLQKLYPYLAQFQGRRNMLKLFFGHRLTETASPVYSHLVRWNNSKHIREHFSTDFSSLLDADPVEELMDHLPAGMKGWDLLSRAQWIESTCFLSSYLLSSQGDRMAMAHSVEGRYPFLDHRVIEFCTRLPENLKIRGLNEKYLLKKVMKGRLPEEVISRPKQAYRAPVATSLASEKAPAYFREMLSGEQLKKHGIFRPDSVERLKEKLHLSKTVTENDNMALAGILSTQILMDLFLHGHNPYRRSELEMNCPVKTDSSIIKNP